MIVDLVDGLEFEASMKFRISMEVWPIEASQCSADQIWLSIEAKSHAEAFALALKWKDDTLPSQGLKNINVYERV